MNNKEKFIAQLDDKITEISNQDAVRTETMKREISDGTMDQTVNNTVSIIMYTYTSCLSAGLSDNQSFFIACKTAGIEMNEPYVD